MLREAAQPDSPPRTFRRSGVFQFIDLLRLNRCRDYIFFRCPISEVDDPAAIAAKRHVGILNFDFFLANRATQGDGPTPIIGQPGEQLLPQKESGTDWLFGRRPLWIVQERQSVHLPNHNRELP